MIGRRLAEQCELILKRAMPRETPDIPRPGAEQIGKEPPLSGGRRERPRARYCVSRCPLAREGKYLLEKQKSSRAFMDRRWRRGRTTVKTPTTSRERNSRLGRCRCSRRCSRSSTSPTRIAIGAFINSTPGRRQKIHLSYTPRKPPRDQRDKHRYYDSEHVRNMAIVHAQAPHGLTLHELK